MRGTPARRALVAASLALAPVAAAAIWLALLDRDLARGGRGERVLVEAAVVLGVLGVQLAALACGVVRRARDPTAREAAWALLALFLALPLVGALALALLPLALPAREGAPSVRAALRAAWRRFAERRRDVPYRRDMALVPMPFMFTLVAACAVASATSLLAATGAAAAAAASAGAVLAEVFVLLLIPLGLLELLAGFLVAAGLAPVAAAGVLLLIAGACVTAGVLTYPPAAAAHGRVLLRFAPAPAAAAPAGDPALAPPAPEAKTARAAPPSAWSLGGWLAALDLALLLTLLFGLAPVQVLATRLLEARDAGADAGPLVALCALLHLAPGLLVAAAWGLLALRLHVREAMALGAPRPLRATARLLLADPGGLSRATARHLALAAGTLLLGAVLLPVAGVPAAAAAALLGALHAVAADAAGWAGLHASLFAAEAVALFFAAVWLVGLVLAPLTLAQALVRLEWVAALLGRPAQPPAAPGRVSLSDPLTPG